MFSRSWLMAAAFVAGGSVAQTVPQSAAQTAAQSAAPGPAPLKYESTFTGYQPYRDGKRGDWRELNDTVRTLGGHAGHLRGAMPEAPVESPAAAPGKPAMPKPAPADPHAGHKM